VVFALLAGKQFGGLTGALLAVPIASVIVSLFGYYRRLVAESYATETGGAVPVDDWDD
jgi:predicted PurR-regulated permease PerM